MRGGGFGWSELPAAGQFQHGTLVASVAAGGRLHPFPFPDPVIVPMALNFDPDEQLEERHYLATLVAESGNDPATLAALDRQHAARLSERHAAADIINGSYGISVDLHSIHGQDLFRVWREDYALLRDHSPLTWAAFTQTNTPAADRTLRVWAAGNDRLQGVAPSVLPEDPFAAFPRVLPGDGRRSLEALGPVHFPELRGQHIAVTALSTDEERLAPYANPCGELPESWDRVRFGKHFCLAAPGTLGDGTQGTSFAAPFVSGVLARLQARFPGVTPRELVKKLMDTADGYREEGFDGGIAVVASPESFSYSVVEGCGDGGDSEDGEECVVVWEEPYLAGDEAVAEERAHARAEERFAFLFGAGRVDVDDENGVFAPVGRLAFSLPGGREAPVAATRLTTPSAWGPLGDRLGELSFVAFDGLNFPFAYDGDAFVFDGARNDGAIPELLAAPSDLSDPSRCEFSPRLAPGLVCVPWRDGARARALFSPDGTGAAVRLGGGLALSAFTRARGRLDGSGSGAFSFDGGSSFAALRIARGRPLGGSQRWRLHGALQLAADLPRGFGTRRGSLLEAGPALLSDWAVGLTHAHRGRRTRLALSQPPRAEAGHGRLTVPGGRHADGTRRYETRRFSLVPAARELTLRLSHQRPLLGGALVLSAHRTEHPGHAPAPARHGVGLYWRRAF